MGDLDLPTEVLLFGFRITPDGMETIEGRFYVCPECGEGHVTHYGGGDYLCGRCDFQY